MVWTLGFHLMGLQQFPKNQAGLTICTMPKKKKTSEGDGTPSSKRRKETEADISTEQSYTPLEPWWKRFQTSVAKN